MNNSPHYQWNENRTLVLNIRVIPGSQKTAFAEITEGVLRIKLNAQPRDNEANDVLINFLAKTFKTPKSRITIIAGTKSRLKRVAIVDPRECPAAAGVHDDKK